MKQIILFLSYFLFIHNGYSASFDCTKSSTNVEKMICENAEISRLDDDLHRAYNQTLKQRQHTGYLKQSQREWLQQRNKCAATQCLEQVYKDQIDLLNLPLVTELLKGEITGRENHTSTLLSNGNIIIVGGSSLTNNTDEVVLYNPLRNTYTFSTMQRTSRLDHRANLLLDGKLLIAGGRSDRYDMLNEAELFDPQTNEIAAASHLNYLSGNEISSVVLQNGKVLFTGVGPEFYGVSEVYDPASGIFVRTGDLTLSRKNHTSTLLNNGKVLLVGGNLEDGSAELFDPNTGRFFMTGSLLVPRMYHTATLLNNNKVLITGGKSKYSISTAEIYDPATGQFSFAGEMNTEREGHTAVLLKDGTVLISGGGNDTHYLPSMEIYNPETDAFRFVGRLFGSGLPTLLQNGKVLFIGTTVEIFDPSITNK